MWPGYVQLPSERWQLLLCSACFAAPRLLQTLLSKAEIAPEERSWSHWRSMMPDTPIMSIQDWNVS